MRTDELTQLDPEDLAALSVASTATISTQLFKHGLRNTYLAGLACMSPHAPRLIGEAFTLRCIPSREDIDVLSIYDDYDHPQRKAVESVGPGQVLVMDCREQGRAASAGSILLTRVAVRGASGVVSDGTLRDAGSIAELELPVFAAGPAAMTNLAQHHAVDLQVPIGCAGVAVYPGDLMVGDQDGVVCIPRHLVHEVATAAPAQEALETFILAKVRAGAPLRGTYPPNADVLAEYAETKAVP